MKGLKKILFEEQQRLTRIVQTTKARLIDMPEGRLRISKSHGNLQYYQCTKGVKGGKYITKGNEELIQRLAQKTYDEKVLRIAERRLSQIKKLADSYEEDEIDKIYFEENELRQTLIEPIEPIWEHKLKEWISKEYEKKGFQEEMPVILTEKGERVRSKSEKIMADHFFRHGIEYKYECPLYLRGTGTIYPDFTFLSPKTGKEIYWEHNGLADSPGYARNMVKKINAYEKNGIFQGERLILTYETEQTILNTDTIERMVKRYLVSDDD